MRNEHKSGADAATTQRARISATATVRTARISAAAATAAVLCAAAKKSSKKSLLLGVGTAVVAALALVLVLVILSAMRGGNSPRISDDDPDLDIEEFVTPGARDVPFEPVDGGFTAYDADIGMIEINQGLTSVRRPTQQV